MSLNAFVGHSFEKEDEYVVQKILNYLDIIKDSSPGFNWVNARKPSAQDVGSKVLELIDGKDIFIGICTAKEYVCKISDLESTWFEKTKKISTEKLYLKTSDWIIQEIGLAIGRNMKLILLVEKDVRVPGGLFGNYERIIFSRNKIEELFPTLLQMINSSSRTNPPHVSSSTIEFSEKIDEEQVLSEEINEVEPKPMEEWAEIDFIFATLKEEDVSSKLLILDEFEKTKNFKRNFDRFEMEVNFWRWNALMKIDGSLEKLLELHKKEPANINALNSLSNTYSRLEMHEEAFKILKIYYETQSFENKIKIVKNLIEKSLKVGKQDEASRVCLEINEQAIFNNNLIKYSELILKAWSAYYLGIKEKNLYCACCELILTLDSSNDDLRSSLADAYLDVGIPELAARHYTVLCKKDDSSKYRNNLGVALDRMDLKGMSISYYLEAVEKGDAYAISNLAFKKISAGFLDEAEKMCRDALKIEKAPERIALALSNVSSKRDEEKKEFEKKIFESSKKINFFENLGNSTLTKQLESGSYCFCWKDDSIVTFQIDSNKIFSMYEVKSKNLLLQTNNYEKYSIEGIINGRAGKVVLKSNKSLTGYFLGNIEEDILFYFNEEITKLSIYNIKNGSLEVFERCSIKEII